jgi:glycosyltransferase involved in cell wall biosynthesis
VPIIVLDTPVAREVYGTAAIYLARPDAGLVADALREVVDSVPLRTNLLTAAAKTLERYSWTSCAERTLQVLVEAGASTR